ncbi:serine hydrolase [Mycobacteroides franklinii]|uniref:serine hydrolase n=1 Tax=Mycobacteroides franklinii TaxID=948102 RepID=UPI0013E8EE20
MKSQNGLRDIPQGVTGRTTDPTKLKIMAGFPPSAERQARFADLSFLAFPQRRWSLSHRRELAPSVNVSRGTAPPRELPGPRSARHDIAGLHFDTLDGDAVTVEEALDAAFVDGIAVLHHGELVYEGYFGEGAPDRPHMTFSITKSVTALLALELIVQGRLQPEERVASYLPALTTSAYADATVRDVLNMAVGVRYVEDYADLDSDVARYGGASGLTPVISPSADAAINTTPAFLQSLRKQGEHGTAFHYVTPTADVLGWLISSVTDRSLAEHFAATVWSRIGAECDAYFHVDSIGTPSAGTGLSMTVRDMARLGELLRCEGRVGGERVLDTRTIARVRASGGEHAQRLFAEAIERTGGHRYLRGWSYQNMFWHVNDAAGAFCARGIYGQNLYVNPVAGVVIARFSSSPVASNDSEDPIMVPMAQSIAKYLAQSGD